MPRSKRLGGIEGIIGTGGTGGTIGIDTIIGIGGIGGIGGIIGVPITVGIIGNTRPEKQPAIEKPAQVAGFSTRPR